MLAVDVRALSKTYRSRLGRTSVQALDGLDLEVAPGEIFGLLGPNGAGKTTLIKSLLGIVRPTSGAAALFGVPVHRPEARRRVGFLPEHHRFPPFLTAEALLHLYGRLAGVSAAERARRVPLLLDRVGLGARKGSKVKTFSKGMLQRAGLAQALLNAPDLLFLDEPTDGVDPAGRREIRDLLVELRGEGRTIFLNSHLLSEVEQVCTRVAILKEGRLVREGTVDELTAIEKVYEIVATPVPDVLLQALGGALVPLDGIPPSSDVPATSALREPLRRYRATAPDRADLNALLDRLRSEGVLLEAVRPLRRSLEDFFVEVTRGE